MLVEAGKKWDETDVESLLAVKTAAVPMLEQQLERALRRLDKFEVFILDDIGYVQQSRGEMEVLFTFLSEWYERRSLIITSNTSASSAQASSLRSGTKFSKTP